MPHLYLIACASLMFMIWRKSISAGWFCFFVLELIRRLAVDIAEMAMK